MQNRRRNECVTTPSVPRTLFPTYLCVSRKEFSSSVCMAVATLHRRGETSRGYDQFAGCDCWRWEVCSCPEITDIESSLTVGTLHTIQSARTPYHGVNHCFVGLLFDFAPFYSFSFSYRVLLILNMTKRTTRIVMISIRDGFDLARPCLTRPYPYAG